MITLGYLFFFNIQIFLNFCFIVNICNCQKNIQFNEYLSYFPYFNDITFNNDNSSINNESVHNIPENKINYIFFNMKRDVLKIIYDLITDINKDNNKELNKIFDIFNKEIECRQFIELFFKDNYFLNLYAAKLFKGGVISNAIGVEDECLEKDEVFLFISGEYSYNSIKDNLISFEHEHILFIESLFFHEEVCLWKVCHKAFKPIFEYIIKNNKPAAKTLFGYKDINLNINIEGINYYTDYEKKITLYSENTDNNDEYITNLSEIINIIAFFFCICTSISIYIENCENRKKRSNNSSNKLEAIEGLEDSEFENNILYEKKKHKINKFYNFVSAFNFFKNSNLINTKKDPLFNQNSLVELSLIRILIIFFIMIGENSYIILKYVDKGRSLLFLTREWLFILIKMGCISYEYYKVLCGTIFGFKFMNYLKKTNNYSIKRIIKFIFKFLPYLIIFLIMHFGYNYPNINFIKHFWGSYRNNYLSNKMNDCFCQKNITNIFFPLSIIDRYNDTNFNLKQYNGCFRPTLFTLSEFFSYLMILIIILFFIIIKSNYLEIIVFIINFASLNISFILTREVKDLNGEYTLSRLFGFSGSIAKPYLFFPLYYIGFNIGVIYYYHLHEAETFNELNTNNYIPFKYCYETSIFLGRLSRTIKLAILYICIFLMIFLSSFYTFIMNSFNNEKLLIFKFEDIYLAKFMYCYEGLFGGLIFSCFILIYLTSSQNMSKIIFSSNLFIFGHKISFVLFNIFHSNIRLIHGISIMEINVSTLFLIKNTLVLFCFSCFFSIIITILFFFPIKWLHLFIWNGCSIEKDELV